MDSIRKWLNKPKADDRSLLAKFYHADKALTAIANELDSFDGRAEPERCSRLVSKLRQGQDRVLAIINQIMDELLCDDRACRAFRVKFPEEVLQESLAGQLWFGAECLAAGSAILNREAESAEMRPLAKAVTKSLENVRNLIRDQCLRNNIPNSPTLMLDRNDPSTETLYESLKIFDRLFAEFEFLYVSAMVQVKSKQEHEMQEEICVLFSETLQRALRLNLLEQEQIDSFDPALMFSIPRLAIITGLIIFDQGPLNMNRKSDELSEMFRPFRKLLVKIRDLLYTLRKNELYQLEKLLCTNDDIEYKTHFVKESFDNDVKKFRPKLSLTSEYSNVYRDRDEENDGKVDDSEWQNDDEMETIDTLKDPDNSDTTSGYLVPNTSLGNLLQSNDVLLTQNFVSNSEFESNAVEDSGLGTTENTSLGQSPDGSRFREEEVFKRFDYDANWERYKTIIEPSCSTDCGEGDVDVERSYRQVRASNYHVQSSTSSSSSSPAHSNNDNLYKTHTVYVRKSGRIKFKNTENLLHRLFVCIAGVADQLQTNFAADLRQILRSVFQMNCTPDDDDTCQTKSDTDEETSDVTSPNTPSSNFEYRANENDVLPENAETLHSVCFGEEVSPESNESSSSSDSDERQDDEEDDDEDVRDEANENSFGIGVSGRNILLANNSNDSNYSPVLNEDELCQLQCDEKYDQAASASVSTATTTANESLPMCCSSCNVQSIARRRTEHDPTTHQITLYFCCQSVSFSCIEED